MKYRVVRSGRRIPGWGNVPPIGSTIEGLPEDLARQLVAQSILVPVPTSKRRPDSVAAPRPDDETEETH